VNEIVFEKVFRLMRGDKILYESRSEIDCEFEAASRGFEKVDLVTVSQKILSIPATFNHPEYCEIASEEILNCREIQTYE
jgi:hypothetical protein